MKSNVLKISIIAIMLVFVYTTVVSALSFTPSMTPSSTVVPEATEFTVEVKVSNLDVGPDGINTMSGVLEYEDKVFEKKQKIILEHYAKEDDKEIVKENILYIPFEYGFYILWSVVTFCEFQQSFKRSRNQRGYFLMYQLCHFLI